uniref:Uncharacterized protein n=1 Tax=Arundo donax TaxID=35708 RepID=A0A0A9U6W8_ARUDO
MRTMGNLTYQCLTGP